MKFADTAKLPQKTSAKVNDPDSAAWTEDMLGAPVLKREPGTQSTLAKVLRSARMVKLLIGGAIVGASLLAFLLLRGGRQSCEAAGGKWGSSQNICVTRACAKTNSCGEWASPAARCKNLKIGDVREEVYFQLGQPTADTSASASWPVSKGLSGKVVARFVNNKLAALDCPIERD